VFSEDINKDVVVELGVSALSDKEPFIKYK
jgi:hypothetical protein